MSEMVCTPCGQPLEPGSSTIVGIEREGKLFFRWACCHHPVGDAAVILASECCAEKWLETHLEYKPDIYELLHEAEMEGGACVHRGKGESH